MPEPGRRIVAEERGGDGAALPWIDPAAFARRAAVMAARDLKTAEAFAGPVFFDRGLIDAAVALEHAAEIPLAETLGGPSPYDDPVFLAPPWPENFARDTDRRHGFDAALAEYERIGLALAALGHRTLTLPKVPVAQRMRFVLAALG